MFFVSLFIGVCIVYAYSLNAERSDDDPEKKEYHLGGMIFTLFTWPLFLFFFISLFLLRVLFYGIFLILFIASLLLFPRERSEPTGLERTAARIGDALLNANMMLIRLFLRPWAREADTI
jgi:cell division protein FtsW (lipid II flippase)